MIDINYINVFDGKKGTDLVRLFFVEKKEISYIICQKND